MAGDGIQVKLESKKYLKAMSKLNTALKKREYLTLVGQDVIAWIDKNFKDQGTTNKWPSMKASTAIARTGGGGGAKLLQDKGTLKQSFDFKINGLDGSVTVFSRDEKAPWHHKGVKLHTITAKGGGVMRFRTAGGWVATRSVRHSIPVRPLMPSEAAGARIMVKTLNAYLTKVLKDFN